MNELKSNRSEQFRAWLKDMDDDKIEKLVRLEKNIRVLLHVWDLVHELDVKAFHHVARVAHQIRTEYEELTK